MSLQKVSCKIFFSNQLPLGQLLLLIDLIITVKSQYKLRRNVQLENIINEVLYNIIEYFLIVNYYTIANYENPQIREDKINIILHILFLKKLARTLQAVTI